MNEIYSLEVYRMRYLVGVFISGASFILISCSTMQNFSRQTLPPDNDMCGASNYQGFVGKTLSSIESTRFPISARAISYYSSVTMDFNLHRLNFLADKSNIITEVYCG